MLQVFGAEDKITQVVDQFTLPRLTNLRHIFTWMRLKEVERLPDALNVQGMILLGPRDLVLVFVLKKKCQNVLLMGQP